MKKQFENTPHEFNLCPVCQTCKYINVYCDENARCDGIGGKYTACHIRSGLEKQEKGEMNMKITFTNLAGNLGNDLIKAIYAAAYRLEATEIIVNSAKYGRYADTSLFCGDSCIDWHYIVAL